PCSASRRSASAGTSPASWWRRPPAPGTRWARTAERHLRRAVATPGAPPERPAQARLSLVTVRTERGHPLQALRIAALAWPALSSLDRAKLDTQRAVALAHLGRYREAVAACDRAVEVLAAAPGSVDDHRFLAGGLLNRGLVHSFLGEWGAAMGDVTACLELARHAGLDHLARLAAANLPFLAVRRGDVAGAFAHYREAEEALFGFCERLATMRADFAGALLAAQQPGEARELLSRAVPDLEASGAHVALADARLKLARAELLTGDPRRALALAARAARELEAQGRVSWLPLAREVSLRARLALDGPAPGLLTELVACAGELERDPAHQAGGAALRLEAAEVALALGDRPAALAQLAELTNAPADVPATAPSGAVVIAEGHGERDTSRRDGRRGGDGAREAERHGVGGRGTESGEVGGRGAEGGEVGGGAESGEVGGRGAGARKKITARKVAALPPALQELIGGEPDPPPERRVPGLVRQHAMALEAELRGDTDAASRAARDGLAEARNQAGAFDDPALRAHMARAGERLAGLGLRLAARDRDAAEVFAWAERWRAVAAPEPHVPDLREVRAALAEAALTEDVLSEDVLTEDAFADAAFARTCSDTTAPGPATADASGFDTATSAAGLPTLAALGETAPGMSAPEEGAPGGRTPADGTPGEGAPAERTPGKRAPREGALGERALGDDAAGATWRGGAVLGGRAAGVGGHGGAVLVEFVVEAASLLVVVVTRDGTLVRRLGRLEEVAEAVVHLRYALRRHTLGDGTAGDGSPVDERTALAPGGPVREAAAEVERLLLRPVEDEIADRPLVVVPAGVQGDPPAAGVRRDARHPGRRDAGRQGRPPP
ncbi:hypothetical protein AB0H81_44575, partial [Nonomuraea sp. NPDC050691]